MSDHLKLLNAVGAYEYNGGSDQFCQDHFLRPKVRYIAYAPTLAYQNNL
jgi:hypothetical protein